MNNMCGKSTGDCFHFGKTSGTSKRKRLRTRKERNKTRHGGKEAFKATSHRHHCLHQGNPDMAHLHNYCHCRSHCSSRKDAAPAGQERSFITDSRLIGHHGLFNHEVKSIDIERLLTNQRKMERDGKRVQKKQMAASHPHPPDTPPPVIRNDLLPGDTAEVVPSQKTSDLITEVHENDRQESNSQDADITPGQRPQHQPDLLPGSSKSDALSKENSPDVDMMENKTKTLFMLEKGRGSMLSTARDRETVKTVKKNTKPSSKRQKPRVHQTSLSRNPSPPQLSTSPTAEASSKKGENIDHLVESLADRLCCSLQFPNLRTRDLAASTRELLVKALQERHGAWLQENLLQLQRCLSFSTACTMAAQDQNQELNTTDEDGLWSADGQNAFSTRYHADTAHQSRGGTCKTAVLKMGGSKPFDWRSGPRLHPSLETTAGWLRSPVDTSVCSSEDLFKPSSSPQFCMDFEVPQTCVDLFAPSHTSGWGPRASVPQYCEDRSHQPKTKKSAMLDFFEDTFMSHSQAGRDRSRTQPPSLHKAWLQDSPVPSLPFRERKTFIHEHYSLAPAFSGQVNSKPQSNHPAFSNVRRPPGWSPRSDMMNYPPSHLLEKSPTHNFSSFPSPAHWSYPPLRLY